MDDDIDDMNKDMNKPFSKISSELNFSQLKLNKLNLNKLNLGEIGKQISQIQPKVWLIIILFFLSATVLLFGGYLSQQIPMIPLPFTQPSKVALVKIDAKGFFPKTLLVKKGTTVIWKNTDSRAHQIISDPHPLHNLLPKLAGPTPLDSNTSYSFTFNTVGTFTYHDELNPLKFTGMVIVE